MVKEFSLSTAFIDIIPVLACSDIATEHQFLVDALGFVSIGIDRASDGTVSHGEVRAGERRIWLHRTSETAKLATPAMLGAAGGGITVYVKDVDAHFEAARGAGATIVSEPKDQPYGQREYSVRDPEGHMWWIATPAVD